MTADWTGSAIALLEADGNRSADTHLHVFPLPAEWGIDLYLKDESVHPTGSLKHRLARSLILYGLVNGRIHEGTTLVEASSGSTAVSEAYFARMLGLPFVTVVPRSTSQEKIDLIEFYGGRCHFVDSGAAMYAEAERLASECGGHYLDQFTYAERATDWRGNNNIAESVFSQLSRERHPIPSWIVVGAGTGGTSATFGSTCATAVTTPASRSWIRRARPSTAAGAPGIRRSRPEHRAASRASEGPGSSPRSCPG